MNYTVMAVLGIIVFLLSALQWTDIASQRVRDVMLIIGFAIVALIYKLF